MGTDGHVHGKPKDNVRVPNVCSGGQVSQARNVRMAVYKAPAPMFEGDNTHMESLQYVHG